MEKLQQRAPSEPLGCAKRSEPVKLAKPKTIFSRVKEGIRELFRYEEPKGTGDFVGGEYEKE